VPAINPKFVTTAFELPGYRTVKNVGVVRGIVVRSRSIIGNIGAGHQLLLVPAVIVRAVHDRRQVHGHVPEHERDRCHEEREAPEAEGDNAPSSSLDRWV
jgi:hypothetical protein